MFYRKFLFYPLFLCLFLSFCSSKKVESGLTDTTITKAEAQEMINQIRRDKFDLILPQIMREHHVDMWIQVMREGNTDPFSANLGSNSGIFIFTDRGEDKIERAVFGHSSDLVRECGAYDIIIKPEIKIPLTGYPECRIPLRELDKAGGTEWPGGPNTELDYRFKGVGEFVAKRDPQRIAINYLENLGSPIFYEFPRLRSDGISLTDYKLLVKALGAKYAKRIVSAEYLITDYLARPVKSEFTLFKIIRKLVSESFQKQFAQIVPGVTKFRDLEASRTVVDKNGNRGRGDYVLQRGDLICLQGGCQSGCYLDPNWKFGNSNDVAFEYGYVLCKGETEVPPNLKKAWADALKVRKIIEDNVKSGRTAGETFEILKQKIEEAGFIYVNRQIFNKDLNPGKTQVPLDMHAAGGGIYAPRIGPLGPDWQRDMILPPNHHFYLEYWVYVPMPEWGAGKYLSLQFHDGAIATESGVEYFYPPPLEIHLIK